MATRPSEDAPERGRGWAPSRIVTAIVGASVLVLLLFTYHATYRRLEWYLWFGPQPFGGESTMYTVVIYANRFTSESAAYLYGPEGDVLIERVNWFFPTPDGKVMVQNAAGDRVFLDRPELFAAVSSEYPHGGL